MSRKVIFIRGPQGSGKTTLMQRAGLEGYNLSQDKIRSILAGDMMNPNGQFTPSHENEPLVYTLFRESRDRRISKGEVVCIDGTLADGNTIYEHWKTFAKEGYKGLVVDLYGFDPDLAQQRNTARVERERVPLKSVEKMRKVAHENPMPPVMLEDENLKVMTVSNDAEAEASINEMHRFLKDPRCALDLSEYDRVVHVGDIQGCFAPLMAEGSPLKEGLDPKAFYVFLGDLFDRGPQNGEVGRWFMDEVYGRPNVALIAGNHEDYVEKQAGAGKSDIDLPNSEWRRFSWPQLKLHGVKSSDCRKISGMMQDYLAYRWRGRDVLCSHAGFAKWPQNLPLISTYQLRRGNDRYNADIDGSWTASEAGRGRYQLHGHRNSAMAPTMASDLSMNLEAQVEFGGHMRFVTLDNEGFTPTDIRSTVYRTMQRDIEVNRAVNRSTASNHAPIMTWIEANEGLPEISSEVLQKMRDHKMISLKDSTSLPGVFSVNFTRAAFSKAAWDDYTTIARGLYIDGQSNTIVARSYEKFFNLNEREETRAETIRERAQYPVYAYDKPNGFLCITGYSERHNEVVIASKSVTDGEFPQMARDVLEAEIGPDGMERLLRFNRDQLASLVFEIEDPERDPHIIALERPKATLLACIRRSEVFEQAPYDTLKKLGDWLGCPVKSSIAVLPNEKALASFHHRVENNPDWGISGKRSEGCVLEDSAGKFHKLKSHYYRNWKRMRGAVVHIRKAKLDGREANLERYEDVPDEFKDFLNWAKTLSAKALELDIIALRNGFEGDRKSIEAIEDPDLAAELAEKQQMEKAAVFTKVIDGILANDKISDESIMRFVSSALDDPEKAEILRAHPRADDLLARSNPLEQTADDVPQMH